MTTRVVQDSKDGHLIVNKVTKGPQVVYHYNYPAYVDGGPWAYPWIYGFSYLFGLYGHGYHHGYYGHHDHYGHGYRHSCNSC